MPPPVPNSADTLRRMTYSMPGIREVNCIRFGQVGANASMLSGRMLAPRLEVAVETSGVLDHLRRELAWVSLVELACDVSDDSFSGYS